MDRWELSKKDRYITSRTRELVSMAVKSGDIYPQVFRQAEAIAKAEWEQYERASVDEVERRKAWEASPDGQAYKAKVAAEREAKAAAAKAAAAREELARREAEKLRRRWWKFWA